MSFLLRADLCNLRIRTGYVTDHGHPMKTHIKESWNLVLWQTRYASAKPKHLGLGFDEGIFSLGVSSPWGTSLTLSLLINLQKITNYQCLQPRFKATSLVSSRVYFPGFSLANYISRLTRLRPILFSSPRPFQIVCIFMTYDVNSSNDVLHHFSSRNCKATVLICFKKTRALID